jgi:hypothetical protein
MPGSTARTERGKFLFKVSEWGPPDYAPFISTEPYTITTTLVGESAFLGFDLNTKDAAEAQAIADFLNENIKCVTFTILDDHPMYKAELPLQ